MEEECEVLDVSPMVGGVELRLSRPIMIDIGTKLDRYEVVLAEPMAEELCATRWEWTCEEVAVGDMVVTLMMSFGQVKPLLCARMRRRMIAISDGPMREFVGHADIALEGYPLARRLPEYDKACRACHGLHHVASGCQEYWSSKKWRPWERLMEFQVHERWKKRKRRGEGDRDAGR